MTAHAIVIGTLSRAPEVKTSKAGKAYTAASIKVMAGDKPEYWSIMAFSEAVQAELARLKEGDTISVQGAFKVENYAARDGQTKLSRTLFADLVLALRQPPRERQSSGPAYDDAGFR